MTIPEVQAMLDGFRRQQDDLRRLWADVMIFDPDVTEAELELLVQQQRREIRETAAIVDDAIACGERMLDRLRARESRSAGLASLIERVSAIDRLRDP